MSESIYILAMLVAGSFEAAAAWQVWSWRRVGGPTGLGFVLTGLLVLSTVSYMSAFLEALYTAIEPAVMSLGSLSALISLAYGLIEGGYIVSLVALAAGTWYLRGVFAGTPGAVDS